jgi:hypothetical protein
MLNPGSSIILEKLVDRETEGDRRRRGADPRHQRSFVSQACAFRRARSAVDGRLPTKQHMEGTGMDPDLDPNLQHWQDRFDSLQWVEGSLVALLDSMPT